MKLLASPKTRLLAAFLLFAVSACELLDRDEECTHNGSCTQPACRSDGTHYLTADEPACEPGELRCSPRGSFVLLCDDDGVLHPHETCAPAQCVELGPEGTAVCADEAPNDDVN